MPSIAQMRPKTAIQRLTGRPVIPIYPELASIIGVTNSICWQQLNYWVSRDVRPNDVIFDGRKWVYNTYAQWQQQLYFLSERTIRKSFSDLEKIGLILTRCEGGVKYYTIDYEAFEELLNSDMTYEDIDRVEEGEEDENEGVAKSARWGGKICQVGWQNLPGGVAKSASTYIDTNITHRLPLEGDAHARDGSHPSDVPPPKQEINLPKKKKSKKGTSLDINWTLPPEWREWSLELGMFNEQIDKTEFIFRNHWISTSKNSTWKNWFKVWQNWCVRECHYKGIPIKKYNLEKKTSPTVVAKPACVVKKQSDDPNIQKWSNIQPRLKIIMGDANYESWIEDHLEVVDLGKKAIFRATSKFVKDYIETNFIGSIALALQDINPVYGIERNIEIIVADNDYTLPNSEPTLIDEQVISLPMNNRNMKIIGSVINNLEMS